MKIAQVLKEADVPKHAHLLVHSAFSGLSRQGWGADDTIAAMLEHITDGALFMPTMTWRTVTPSNPTWDAKGTASHTGVLSELFRTMYATERSTHPTHSVAGYGRDAGALLSRHHVDDTPVSENSPYGLLRDYDTHVLMLGVGLESCTAIHLPEETIAEPLYVRKESFTYKCRALDGRVYSVPARRHHRLERDFPKFEAPLVAKGLLRKGEVGDTRWIAVRMRDLLREVFQALLRDERATLRA